jgi:hypothetical protein
LKQRGTEEIGGIKFFVLYEIKKSDSRLQDWFLNDNFPKSSSGFSVPLCFRGVSSVALWQSQYKVANDIALNL